MRIRTIVTAAAMIPLFMAGVASAQSTNTGTNQSLGVVSNPVTSGVSSGSGVALGTITLTSPGGTYMVNSVPVNLSVTGGQATNLSNCQIYNQTASTTQALGSAFSPVAGQNSFAFANQLMVQSGTPVTLQIRCDVNASTPSGSTFQFTAGSGIGSSTSGASLAAQVDFVKQIPAGLSNAIIGIMTLDATRSSQAVTVNSIPIAVSASGGADLSALRNCYVSNMSGTRLTTGGNAISAITGDNRFVLDSPLTIAPGQGMIVAVRCDVSSTVPVGSRLMFSFAPSAFSATANGAPVTVTQGFASAGQIGTNSGSVTVAPVGTSQGSTGTPSVPGTPNTGLGDQATMNIVFLAILALVAFVATRRAMR